MTRRYWIAIVLGVACFVASPSFAQSLPGGMQQITVPTGDSGATATFPALLSLPNDYNSTSQNYPLLVFLHGAGEASYPYDLSKIYNSSVSGGPPYFIAHNSFPSSFTVNGNTYKFIVVAPQANTWSVTSRQLISVINNLVSTYRVDTNRIYLTGLSAGGEGVTFYTVHKDDNNTISPTYEPAAIVPMSSATGSFSVQPSWGTTTVNDNVHAWGFGDPINDWHGENTKLYIDSVKAADATFGRFTSYTGGHCCWNTYYNPSYTETINGTAMNIYQWLLQYARSGSVTPPSNQSPTANAGTDQTITATSVTLNGTGTDSDGTIISYAWTKTAGGTATITSPSAASTSITGLSAGSYTFQLTVTDNGGATATDTVNITVNGASGGTGAYGGTAGAIPGTIQAENFDLGGEGVAYHETTAANQGGMYRTSEAVDIETTGDTGGGYDVGWNAATEWYKYTVSVASTGTYTMTARVASAFSGITFNVEVDGSLLTTVTVPLTGGWQTWQTVTKTGLSLTAGTHVIRIYDNADGYNINWFAFVYTGGSSNIAPTANAGTDKAITLPTSSTLFTGSGTDSDGTIASYAWTNTVKPAGATTPTISSPSSASTNITGLSTAGTYTFRLTVTDNAGATATDDVNVTVSSATNQAPTANAGTDQSFALPTTSTTLTGTGTDTDGTIASYLWTKTAGGTATIASPTSASTNITGLSQGTYTFQLTVTDNGGATATDTVDVVVNAALPTGSAPTQDIGMGEYQAFYIDNAGKLYATGALTTTGSGGGGKQGVTRLVSVSPSSTTFRYVAGNLHGGAAIDTSGNVWTMGDAADGLAGVGSTTTSQVAQKITTDANGNAFTNVASLAGYFIQGSYFKAGWLAVKQDGTVWQWGTNAGGMGGYGVDDATAVLRPQQIAIPGGRQIVQITGGDYALALASDGTVWSWGPGAVANLGYAMTGTQYTTPHQITGLSNITQIAGGKGFNYALASNGTLYGWGVYASNLGDTVAGSTFTPYSTPRALAIQNALPSPIKKIVVNFVTTTVLLNDGSVWNWGDNTQGTIGNGQEWLGGANGYSWDFNMGKLFVATPYHVMPGKTFSDIYGGYTWVFYTYVKDTNGQLYAWGRNKGSVIANKIEGAGTGGIQASYPNAWDVVWPTPVNPFTVTTDYLSTSPNCITSPTDTSCSEYTVPSNTAPTANAGADQNISAASATLNGSASSDNVYIGYYEWKQISGPNTASIDVPASPTPTVSGLITGSYVFQLKTTDNGWLTGTDTVTINVNGAAPANAAPVVNAGTDTSITLPASSATLSGSATDSDGTISSYAWTKILGGTATIGSPNSASTTVSGLTQGTYTFRLTATDNDGAASFDDVLITVNASPNNPPSANAGSDITITLPTNSTTLRGSGSDTEGTVASYGWTKISGQGTIASPNSVNTNITGLTAAGTSTFRLTVTDNLGATATDDINIIVNPAPNTPPTVNAGVDVSITLPVSSITLTATATDPDADTMTYAWTKTSGGTATIGSASSLSTTVSGLAAGTYTFQFMATDSKGASASDTVTVTVNAAIPVNNAPIVNAGLDKSITLPTSSLTLTATAADVDGDTMTYSWTKVSGPATPTIGSATSLSTFVSALSSAGTYTFRFTATDSKGLSTSDDVAVIVNGAVVTPNNAPIVSAGINQTITLPISSVVLAATATDPDADAMTYVWTKTSGGIATFSSTTTLATTVSSLAAGTYIFQFTATDAKGAATSDSVTITVNAAIPANVPPVVSAGTGQTITLPTNSVTLNGSATDSDGTIASALWTKVSGPTVIIVSPASLSTAASNLVEGTYVFSLTATDNKGATGSDSVTITVNPQPTTSGGGGGGGGGSSHGGGGGSSKGHGKPTALAGTDVTTALPIDSAVLVGTGGDADGAVTYEWSKTSGSGGTIEYPTRSTTTVKGLKKGNYTFELTVTDTDGNTATDFVNVTVLDANTTQLVSSANTTATTTTTTLSGSGTGSSSGSGSGRVRTSASKLNVRSAPISGSVIAQVPFGTSGTLITSANGWYQVQFDSGVTGWVSSTYATISAPTTTIPTGSSTGSSGTVTASRLNVRSAPISGSVISQVTAGTILPILSTSGGWSQVQLPTGATGWVSNAYLSGITSMPAPTPLPTTTSTTIPTATNTFSVLDAVRTTASNLNVRSAPNGSLLGKVPSGTTGTVISVSGSWAQVYFSTGLTGYVSMAYLAK